MSSVSKSLTCSDTLAILVPLNAHERVAQGLDLGLEVGILALQDLPKVSEGLDEGGLDMGGLIHGDCTLEA